MRRLEMLKAREILRLKHEVRLSLREIGQACNCGKTTVFEILERAKKAGITWPIELNDKQLMSILYPPLENRIFIPEPDMEYVFCEMKKKGVTLMLLWEEYKEKYPNGIMYTQFCERYRNFKKSNKITLHKEHKAGEEVEVDWAGNTISYVDTETGEVKVLKVLYLADPGKAINPATVEGQLEGAIAQSLGYVLTEDYVISNKTGALESDNLDTYKVVSALDMPETEVILFEKPVPSGPFGAKGIAQGAMIAVTPSIANAVYDAVGVFITDMPATPEKILAALKRSQTIH